MTKYPNFFTEFLQDIIEDKYDFSDKTRTLAFGLFACNKPQPSPYCSAITSWRVYARKAGFNKEEVDRLERLHKHWLDSFFKPLS
jgi:hypothetical protein